MNTLVGDSPGLMKFECGVCHDFKTILGFYFDRKSKRRSWECRVCRGKRVKGRPIPQNMEAGEWQPGRSDGYAVMQLVMRRKARR